MSSSLQPPRGILLGAALMYLLDPEKGHRRRAVVTDKALKLRRQAGRALRVATHDLQNRATGALTRAGLLLERSEADARRIEARIRTRLGRACSHPRAIAVSVDNGVATVAGPVLLDEWRGVRHAIKGAKGVTDVEDRLEIHTVADIPRLMGGRRRGRRIAETLNGPWSPATRLVVGSIGLAATLASLALPKAKRRIALGAGMTLVGSAVGREVLAWQRRTREHGAKAAAAPVGVDELAEASGEFELIS